MAYIYKYTNIQNDKSYIGFTVSISKRQAVHIHRAIILKKRTKFYNAIRKYGIDSFLFEIIEESDNAEYLLKEREPYYIRKFNSFGKGGYNLTVGGDGSLGYKHSKEAKNLISVARKGKKQTPEHIKKIAIAKHKTIVITFSNGTKETISGINDFCVLRGYTRQSIFLVAKGQRKKHKDIIKVESA